MFERVLALTLTRPHNIWRNSIFFPSSGKSFQFAVAISAMKRAHIYTFLWLFCEIQLLFVQNKKKRSTQHHNNLKDTNKVKSKKEAKVLMCKTHICFFLLWYDFAFGLSITLIEWEEEKKKNRFRLRLEQVVHLTTKMNWQWKKPRSYELLYYRKEEEEKN